MLIMLQCKQCHEGLTSGVIRLLEDKKIYDVKPSRITGLLKDVRNSILFPTSTMGVSLYSLEEVKLAKAALIYINWDHLYANLPTSAPEPFKGTVIQILFDMQQQLEPTMMMEENNMPNDESRDQVNSPSLSFQSSVMKVKT